MFSNKLNPNHPNAIILSSNNTNYTNGFFASEKQSRALGTKRGLVVSGFIGKKENKKTNLRVRRVVA